MTSDALEHYLRDTSRRGSAADDAFSGAAGGAPCGDLIRVSVTLDDGRVAATSFDAEGCAAARAAGAAVAEAADGAPVLEAASIGRADVSDALGGLSPQGLHAAELAADALHRALAVAAASDRPLAPPPGSGERVLVAMSGGVDSAVAAVLEREGGADVVAVTLKLWADRHTDAAKSCCSPLAVLGARELAHALDIPHLTLDLEQGFRRAVVGAFVAGYRDGTTPNPCVICNGEVRIAAMVALADRLGATALATGHYARVIDDGEGPLLSPAADPGKDQAYMLSALPTELLGRLRFPLAELTKPEVRAIAQRHGLAVAGKPESQDLCFLAGQGKRAFLRRHGGLGDREGDLVDRHGRRLGRHRGHHHFTVGQRRGIGVGAPEPLYVLGTDATANTVTVGTRAELETATVPVRGATLHRAAARVDRVRLRYHAKAIPCRVVEKGHVPAGRHERLTLELSEPVHGVAPGQTASLMAGDVIVGHATIASPNAA
ncbi:MAG TPA: tRNA 2-thiouridine(34) synthase MnmA [Solirubrobacterales bacterium]|jgi:tRNA-specific 2-thiouridylase|nr:tRNA 2-thiouridine(34) synthase MnmA [Solirubrobacterales bacterium]